MRSVFAALLVGAVFGAGLVLSDMVNPARVQAFLDVTGQWDPTLMFVMGAALLPSALAYLIRRKLTRPVLADRFVVMSRGEVVARGTRDDMGSAEVRRHLSV